MDSKEPKPKQLDPNIVYKEERYFPLLSTSIDHASDKELENIVRMIMVKAIKRSNKEDPKGVYHCMASLNMKDSSFHFAVVDTEKDI